MKVNSSRKSSEAKTIIARSISLLEKRDRKKIKLIIFLQIILGVLDLFGIALIGAIGALAVNGISSKNQTVAVARLLEFMNLENFEFQTQVALLGMMATGFLVSRTILSVYFQKRILYFLSFKSSQLSGSLFERFIARPLTSIRVKSSQDSLFALTAGVTTIMIGIIGAIISLISDAAVLLILFSGLFIFNTAIAINTLVFFSVVAFVLYKSLSNKAKKLGYLNTQLQIQSNKEILDILVGFRELFVRNAIYPYSQNVIQTRTKLSASTAELAFLPYVSKYIIESSVVLGTLIICAAQFLLQDAVNAVATLAVFLSAGSRIAPAVLRMQQGAMQIKANIGSAKPTLDLIDELANVSPISINNNSIDREFDPSIKLSNVCYSYEQSGTFQIDEVSLWLPRGSHTALVGPSGAGKSTLVDLILGIMNPMKGAIEISGVSPRSAVEGWPLAISYLPQEVCLIEGTVLDNLHFGISSKEFSKDRAWEVLDAVGLGDYLRTEADGLETLVGERGSRFSGGQRQRLGIARVLYPKPSILVLDEATSALDGQTEALLTEAIQGLRGSVTLITVAHRLSTVVNADQVVYMEGGRIIQTGTFEQVRELVPNFDIQANLLGL